MPKIRSYTPAWLSKPSPGHDLFTPSASDTPKPSSIYSSTRANAISGPRRTIARRGSEVFVAVGTEIRWADLVYLKERWQEKEAQGHNGIRIKQENSPGPGDDELLRASIENGCAQGFRVSNPSARTRALSRSLPFSPPHQVSWMLSWTY